MSETIWIIGTMFTFGITISASAGDDELEWYHWLLAIILLPIIWPVILGMEVNCVFEAVRNGGKK